jgi:chromosomal replication initiation ATPase DnaA
MNIKKWELTHCPSKDRDRWRLKLKIDEGDMSALTEQLPITLGQPFMIEDEDFTVAYYLFDLTESTTSALRSVLNAHTVPVGAVRQQTSTHPVQFQHLALIPRYTFQEFVIGSNNRFTAAAAQAVADNSGKIYNPFFIYGGVGLGKTHLMHAVGHYILEKNPDVKVAYVTTEKFISDVIDAVRNGVLQEMREHYRQVDLLLIDDIQFLVNSESTQEEFFHTFNILHQSSKQIIITSDRPPKHLTTLEDRLRSRFEWGLIADIKSPNLETRVAILKKKGESENLNLDENMLLYIASKLKSNIRELEGFLKRINAYATLTHQDVTMDLVKSIMADLLPAEEVDEAPKKPSYSSTPLAQPPINLAGTSVSPTPIPTPAQAPTPVPVAVSPTVAEHSVKPPLAPAPVAESVAPPPITISKPLSPPVISVPKTNPPAFSSSAKTIEADPMLKPVEVGFFYPLSKETELSTVKERFTEVIKKHKLKFHLVGILEQDYSPDGAIDYFAFPRMCKEHKATIAVVLGPETNLGSESEEFATTLAATMDEANISLQLIPWQELNKDYRYLNLALDITLIKSKS